MAKIDITKTELVWPGKYDEDGTLKDVPRVSLPFQVIETVNESRATREVQKVTSLGLFDTYQGNEGDTFEAGWRNKLIWGDNLLATGSLLAKFGGKLKLIYIDPPFATGTDFGFTAEVGDSGHEIVKEQSALEEKAYRDTWGKGIESYLAMLSDRLRLCRDLLADDGSIYVHVGWQVSFLVKCLLDEIFGLTGFQNEIIWKRQTAKGGAFGKLSQYGRIHESILFYTKGESWTWNQLFTQYSQEHEESSYRYMDQGIGKRYSRRDLTAAGSRKGDSGKSIRIGGDTIQLPPGRHWAVGLEEGETVQRAVDRLVKSGTIWYEAGKMPRLKLYLEDMPGVPLQSIWSDIPPVQAQSDERLGYDTQKPEALLSRIIQVSSNPGDLIADCFCGSGTTLAVAEKLGRRWIGCDLGRWSIHVTRKRLLGIENCRPFEVLNLGKYERKYWQGVTFGVAKDKPITERALYEYLAFILKLYGAHPVAGLAHLHGKKNKALVHIGAVDAPVTFAEIDAAVDECAKLKQSELHVLGWEWEMGLAGPNNEVRKPGPVQDLVKKKNIKLVLLQIPREVMEQQAAAKGDVRFFELAYLEAEIKHPKKLTTQVVLKDFVVPDTELIPEEVRSKVKKWSDYIDYWAVDWDFRNDTFMQGWVAYRTRKERKLPLTSDAHTYEKPGRYRALVKVIDIFGNDTSKVLDVEVK
jgi:DNA modification methylase